MMRRKQMHRPRVRCGLHLLYACYTGRSTTAKSVSNPDPLPYVKPQPYPEQDIAQSSRKTATVIPTGNVATMKVQGLLSAKSPELGKSTSFLFVDRSLGSIYQLGWGVNINCGYGFSIEAKIRTRGQITEESYSQDSQTGSEDPSENLETLLEAEVDIKKAAEAKNVELAKELERLRIHSSMGHWTWPTPGRMSEGLKHGIEHGKVGRDLADVKSYKPEANSNFSQLKIPIYLEVCDPEDPWAFKEDMLFEDVIAANKSRAKKRSAGWFVAPIGLVSHITPDLTAIVDAAGYCCQISVAEKNDAAKSSKNCYNRKWLNDSKIVSAPVVSAAKLPILNPNEFDLWKMRIKQYFLMTDYSLWEVIINGDSPVPTVVIDEKRFGGNTETKKVQKTLLKQQFENFTSSSSEDLDQIHDRLQKLVSQLEIHEVSLSQEDVNLKFLRSLPSEWKTHTLIWRNKANLEEHSLDDLFNYLRIYEAEVKHSSSPGNPTQNIAFMSSSNTDSTTDLNQLCFQEEFDAKKARKKATQQYMLFPVWSTGFSNPQNKKGDVAFDGKEHDAKKPKSAVNLSPSTSAQSGRQDDMTKKKDKGKSHVEYFTRNR
uniref:Uncharacterized protein n=1 Tax=Tanacetum cinerariifolium TaxID=118510 RepID=A0A6L2M1M5_TANCI|nr:hypothetical protein [Tanacetum cinerariifolium]